MDEFESRVPQTFTLVLFSTSYSMSFSPHPQKKKRERSNSGKLSRNRIRHFPGKKILALVALPSRLVLAAVAPDNDVCLYGGLAGKITFFLLFLLWVRYRYLWNKDTLLYFRFMDVKNILLMMVMGVVVMAIIIIMSHSLKVSFIFM